MAQRTFVRRGTPTRLALLSAAVILALSGTALAQAGRGTLQGDVKDPQGGPSPRDCDRHGDQTHTARTATPERHYAF